MGDRLRCHQCRDVIGIYEPMIAFVDGLAYETSQAAEPDTNNRASECYHQACFRERGDDSTASTRW